MSRFLLRSAPLLRRPLTGTIHPILRRAVASTVTNRPASQTFEHAALNIKEETGNAAADIAKVIAGANMTNDAIKDEGSFLGITSNIASQVPKPYLVMGLAGGLPYVGASLTTVYLASQAGLAASGAQINMDPGVALTILDQALNLQVTYGAVMLSFLGALHWGMEFSGFGGHQGYRRLMLGAAPIVFAWPTLALQPMTALLFQWVGFTGLWWADAKVTGMGWAPKWYAQYRFYLSILVGTCIIGSLAGTSYYGPVAGHGFIARDLELIREQRKSLIKEGEGVVTKGNIGSTLDDKGDAFVVLRKKKEPEEDKQ
ncbi:hypothetical protein E1B28_009263 [Marasmius oreades]|uniref:Uncharacterized protein n=1 Tax=Marasmius oreades TaxID=181124 RepID=A0A9P7S1D2_9AGAR|nr:uncharacterized protein E1B28_009263 [Marasmius oreades]KAG7092961.1 hypothetical protein E1B28_009263 [Marasmius oreades]